MTKLNNRAVEVIHQGGFAVHAATDITGFGIVGHAREMANGSKTTIRIEAERIELLRGALECVRAGFIPGGLNTNRDFAESCVAYKSNVSDELKTLLYDPQTAGGLLLSIPREITKGVVAAMEVAGVPAVRIGEVLPKGEKPIEIV
jgi:selenide,water dikinase